MKVFGVYLPQKELLCEFSADFIKGKTGIWSYIAALGVILGAIGILSIFLLGHGETTNTSSYVPWGLQISTYVYFALVSGGCIFTNFIGTRFFYDHYKPLASRIIFMGLITAIAGFASLASELGHVERMYMFIISPNPTSPMFWMSVWYTADIAILIVEYICIQSNIHSKRVLYASFIIPVITYCSLGSLFGAVGTIPYFYSSLLPVYFIFTGFLTGNALCALIAAMYARKRGNNEIIASFISMQKIGLAIVLILTLSRIIIGLTGNANGYEVFKETLPQNILFGVIAALVIPYIILAKNITKNSLLISSLIVLFTQFMARLDLVVEGFRMPNFQVYDMPARTSYTPSIYELLVVVFSVSIVAIIYIVCEKTGLFETAGIKGGE